MPELTGLKKKPKRYTEGEMREYKRGPGNVNQKNKKNKPYQIKKK
jgi:hypothetical protein